MYKIILIGLLVSSIAGCKHAPRLERTPVIWVGAPEQASICRKVRDEIVCIPAEDEKFKDFACMTWDDVGMIQEYISTLLYSCKRWKKNKAVILEDEDEDFY